MAAEPQIASPEQDPSAYTPPKPSELTLVPYVPLDNDWILPESFLVQMYEKTRDEGLLKTVFWTREMSMADFIGMCQLAGNCLVFAFMGRECVGYAWLNGMSDNHAMAHFCLFKSIWGRRTEQVGKAILEHWFSFPGDDGPLFDTILGIVPGFNRRAHRFIERLGFIHLGTVPNMLKNRFDREDAEIFYISRLNDG